MRNPTLNKIIHLIRLAQLAQKNGMSVESLLELREENLSQKNLTRRDVLKGAAKSMAVLPLAGFWSPPTIASEIPSKIPMDPIVIIGAGTAGLVTAHRLRKAGLPAVVYEASHRVGGRMFTSRNFNSEGMFCEMGGEFVDSGHTDLIQLCQELGVGLESLRFEDTDLESDLFYADGRVISSKEMLSAFQPLASQIAADLKEIFGEEEVRVPTYQDIHQPNIVKYDRMSLEEYLYSKKDVQKWVLDLINVLYLCEYGLETGEQSALALLTLISADTSDGLKLLGESDESHRIAGGSSSLPEALARSIHGEVPIHFNHRLVQIRDTWRGLKLTFLKGQTPVEIFARQVVSAVPFSVLRNVEGIRHLGLSPASQECIRNMGYGTNSKLMMGFERRVWRDKTGTASNGSLLTVERQQFWETSRAQVGKRGILTNYLGGEMGKHIPHDQIASGLQLLNRVYPGIQEQFSYHAILQNWSKSPWTRGSYSCMKPGQYTTMSGISAEPELSGRLIFVGEHTSVDYGGFMNGAVQSGNLAAQRILETRKVEFVQDALRHNGITPLWPYLG